MQREQNYPSYLTRSIGTHSSEQIGPSDLKAYRVPGNVHIIIGRFSHAY